jgi:ubiquinone biosynthesis protein
MGLLRFARTYRSLKRLRRILGVLARHGFGELIDRLNLTRYVPALKRLRSLPVEEATKLDREASAARRLRLVFEELGPSFVKLGQMLSGRPDLIGEPYLNELGRLRDHVAPFDFAHVKRCVEHELGGPIDEVFRAFNPKCLASGSMAQVHCATTVEGDDVVVKVKRPGIDKIVLTDVDLMMQIAELLEKRVPEFGVLRPTLVVEEFARGIKRELDFITEASLTRRFAKSFEGDRTVCVPAVYWEYTTSSVLTLQRITGVPVSSPEALKRKGVDLKKLARHIAEVFMKQFYNTGLFHADPHAGNLLVCDHDVLCILDFGLVGQLSDSLREQLGTLMIATVQGKVEVVVEVFTDMGILGDVSDLDGLKAEIRDLLDRYYGIPLKLVDNRRLFLEVMETARRYQAVMPREFVLLARSFTTIEGIALSLDSDFDISAVAKPYARRLVAQKLSPVRIARRLGRILWELAGMVRRTPRGLREFYHRLMHGELSFILQHKGLEDFTLELERASNRISFSVVVAALVVASSILVLADVGPKYGGMPFFGLLGYSVAAILGFWLLLAILRRGRL